MLDKSLTFGERLRIIRKKKGLQQQELAKRTGINQSHISNYEHGKYIPTISTLKLFCEALGVTATQLLGY